MKRRLFVIGTLIALAGCQQKPFQPFTSPDGKFETKFPGDPKVTVTVAAGATLKMYAVESWNKAYMIGWADMPIPVWETEGKTASRLFDARDGALTAVNAKSNGTTKVIQLQDRFPGIEFGGVAEGKHLRAKIYLVGRRLYQTLVVGNSAEVLTTPEADEFFAAFMVFDVEGLLPPGSGMALPKAPPPPPTHPIESASGRFQANYPVKPKKFTRNIGDAEFTGYECEAKDGTCSVAFADLSIPGGEPEAKIRERIDAARTAAIAEAQATLESEKDATIGSGRPGREFTANANGKQLRGRVFLVGARLYQITVLGSDTYAGSKDATAFLDSFNLK